MYLTFSRRAGLVLPERWQQFKNFISMDILSLSKQIPDLTISVRAADLTEMVRFCVSEMKLQLEQKLTDESVEKYLSPQKVAELLECDISTIWRHDKKGFLNPVYFGGKKRYKYSDIKKIMGGAAV